MSYKSRYELKVINDKYYEGYHKSEIEEMVGFDCFYERTSHFTSYKIMCEYSKKYPNCIFVITRYGEEPLDIDKTYFKDGKFQTCKLVVKFDEYDETKLKNL